MKLKQLCNRATSSECSRCSKSIISIILTNLTPVYIWGVDKDLNHVDLMPKSLIETLSDNILQYSLGNISIGS